MYESYWQLETKPFEDTSDARFYYPSEVHQGALLKLRYAIENRRGAALLTGATGLGKTLLVQALAAQLPSEFSPLVHLVFPDMPSDQLLAYLAGSLTGEATATMPSVQQSVRRLERALEENAEMGGHAVVVIDEAHLLRDTTLETVRLLLNFHKDLAPSMTLLLVGQPSLLPTLDRMLDLNGRMSVKCLLRPFTTEETMGYVSHRVSAAGADKPIFDSKALEAIHYYSQGVCRTINRICDLALLIGFAEEQSEIKAEQIEAVSEELITVTPE